MTDLILEHLPGFRQQGPKEWAGPCFSCGGEDRFRAWPDQGPDKGSGPVGNVWCRRCDYKGDGISLLMDRDGLSFPEAVEAFGGRLAPRDTLSPAAARDRDARRPRPEPVAPEPSAPAGAPISQPVTHCPEEEARAAQATTESLLVGFRLELKAEAPNRARLDAYGTELARRVQAAMLMERRFYELHPGQADCYARTQLGEHVSRDAMSLRTDPPQTWRGYGDWLDRDGMPVRPRSPACGPYTFRPDFAAIERAERRGLEVPADLLRYIRTNNLKPQTHALHR